MLTTSRRATHPAARADRVGPGLVVAALGALAGMAVHAGASSVSAHVVAVLVGVAVANLPFGWRVPPVGLRIAGRHVLRIGIAVLGLRLSLGELVRLGPANLGVVVVTVAVTFVGTRALGRAMGVSRGCSLLVATGYSICGASAIAAVEPIAEATEEEVAYSIALVALCGSVAIGVLPVLGSLAGLPSDVFGAWVGASVHDVGQVVAAASTRDSAAVEAAVVVKLTRVALLAPLLAVVSIEAHRRRRTADATEPHETARRGPARGRRPAIVPWFVVAFVAAAAARSTGMVSARELDAARTVETFLVGAGLVGLGSQVVWHRLRTLGGRPLLLGLASWVVVGGVSFAAVHVAG